MKVSVCARGFILTEALQHAVEQEARAFGRALPDRVGHVSVRLYDINGKRGGPDMACSVQARLDGGPATVVATDIDANMYRAIAGAFAKLERGARNALARSRARRPGPRARTAPFPA